MNNYKYKITKDESFYFERFKGKYLETPFLNIDNGWITVKGSYRAPNIDGYAWNGCTGAIDTDKTYTASCIHDVLYQFNAVPRAMADKVFKQVLHKNRFLFAKIYYFAVRLFGWIFY
jgi:hypothetical protein